MRTKCEQLSVVAPLSPAKLRGGYYTPTSLARWLTLWAIRSPNDSVLEPSCGDGEFLHAAATRLLALGADQNGIERKIVGVEIDKREAVKAGERASAIGGVDGTKIVTCQDFFTWFRRNEPKSFNCVLGNPPFIRYQNFPEPCRTRAMGIMENLGLHPNKLTNIWVPFVTCSVAKLAIGGRLAMVLPAELLQVSYASQLRSYLARNFGTIDVFTCNALFFANAEQEVVLLLADGRRETSCAMSSEIHLHEADTVEELLLTVPRSPTTKPSSLTKQKHVEHGTEKWLKYFLSARDIGFMRDLRNNAAATTLKTHASVDVGVVTGRNEFFVLTHADVGRLAIHEFVVRLIGRSSQLPGAILRDTEHNELGRDGKAVYLLYTNGHRKNELPAGLRRRIDDAESQGVNKGYKCSIRDPWYSVPSVWQPHCFLFRQIYDFPRVVLNQANATSTDTIHRMKCASDPHRTASNLYTHLTAACAEIEGRSYGGGVLELEPTEAEHLLAPRTLTDAMPLAEVDALVRVGRLDEVLKENDRRVLQDGMGLSPRDCRILQRIWIKMRDRRMSRRRRA